MSARSRSLTVVHGPFEALEDAFAARVAELKPGPKDAPLLVVAPSRVLADRLERLLAVEKGLPLMGVHFHTFHSLAAAVVEETGFPDAALVSDPVFHDAVVDRVLDRASSLGISKELRPKALSSAVRSSLRDLLDAGVDPALVAEHFGSTLLRDEEEAARLNALLALAAAYGRELEKLGVLAPSALARAAAEAAPSSALLGGFREILYYGFYDLTGLQLDFFHAVTTSFPSRLYFPHRAGHPAFRFAQDLFEQHLSGGALEPAGAAGNPGTALGEALDSLFDPARPAALRLNGAVSVVSASGERDEAWAAAKEAARMCAAGTPLSEIAVVARSLEPYRLQLAAAFAAEGLPLDLSCGEPVLRHPLAKAALDLLTLSERDLPARVVEDLACSPYFASADARRAERWRRLISALGIRAGWLQWRGKLEARAAGPVELMPRRVREGLPGELVPAADAKALWDFVAGAREAFSGPPAAWGDRCAAARAHLAAHLALPRDPSPAERDAWDAVTGALDELEAFDRLGEPCSWEDFLSAFERKLSRATRDAGDGLLGARGLDAMDLRGHRFSAVIVVGLKEKLFPRQVLEDPLLRDAARAVLRHPAGFWIGRKAAGHEEERLLFYLTVAAARDSLTLIYPRSDEQGKASVPSTYLRELCRAAGLPPPGEDGARRVPRQPAERLRSLPPELLTPREASLLAALDGRAPDAELAAADPGLPALTEALERVAALNDAGAPGRHDGLTSPPAEELAAWRKSGLSPKAFDLYAECPFKFFASRALDLGEREEAPGRGELSPRARGIVYHAALERFYGSLPAAVWESGADWGPAFDAALAAVFAENDWKELGVYPLLWESARLDMTARLRAFVSWDLERLKAAKYRPALFEKKLAGSPEGGAPGGVPWKGVADRVDADPVNRSFRVVDYKTKGGAHLKNMKKKVAEGKTHQLPFYAELAGSALGGPNWEFDGAELLFLEAEDDDERSEPLTAAEWKSARAAFLELAAARVDAIAAGRFPIRPEDGEHGVCSRCEFPALCRKSHAPTRARARKVVLPGEA